MRILLCHPGPDFSVADVFRGYVKALRKLGHEVMVFNTNDRLSLYASAQIPDYSFPPENRPLKKAFDSEQAMVMAMQGLTHDLYNFWPHVVIFVSAFYTSAQTLRVIKARGHKIVIIHTESPYQDDEQLVRAQFADLNLVNDPTNLDEYRMLAPNSHYMPHAYDPKVHFPGDEKETDFAFIGTIFKSRKEFFERFFYGIDAYNLVDKGLKIAFGGAGFDNEYMDGSPLLKLLSHARGECVDNDVVAEAYRATKSGINFYRREGEGEHKDEGWSIGPREVEMAACGIPFLRDPRPESDSLFPFLPSFTSPEEAADQFEWLLADEERRKDLGHKARLAVADRTFENNAKQLLKYLEK